MKGIRDLLRRSKAQKAAHAEQYTPTIAEKRVNSIFNEATAEDISAIFTIMLGRALPAEQCAPFINTNARISDVLNIVMKSNELTRRVVKSSAVSDTGQIDDHTYRIPTELKLTNDSISNVLIVGSCMLESMVKTLSMHEKDTNFEFLNFYNCSPLPPITEGMAQEYDFQLSQIALRSLIHESEYLQIYYDDEKSYEDLFRRACTRLEENIESITKYNKEYGLITFVLNFQSIQQNPMGRLQPRYAFSNMSFFIEELNKFLYHKVCEKHNVFIIDLDQICNMYGKKYFAEDLVFVMSHNAFLVDIESRFDEPRLEPLGSTTLLYGSRTEKLMMTILEEAKSALRVIRQVDAVKLVIFDLDDTLWRGVIAEKETADPDSTEGWPIGLVEAASYLWRRGVMIAIVSKNDIENVRYIWNELYGTRFSLDKFVKVIANWRPKSENISELLKDVNILPESVLFVDDNPAERSNVKAAFPEIRVLDVPLVSWRRILMWSNETQRLNVTTEAAQRTTMVQAQIRREETRKQMSRADFLISLDIQVTCSKVSDQTDRRFSRCLELLNKTNQFNTTGNRWTPAEAKTHFDKGGYWLAFDVKDVHTTYGITSIMIVKRNVIEQFVLSCRVFGMDIELAAIEAARTKALKDGYSDIHGISVSTEKNKLSRDIFSRAGFLEKADGVATRNLDDIRIPGHIKLLYQG